MQAHPVVYGAAYSVYVQAVRLTLWAKSVRHDLVEVDVFAPGGPPAEYLLRQVEPRRSACATDVCAFMAAPDAGELMAPNKRLAAWWRRAGEHVSSAGIL